MKPKQKNNFKTKQIWGFSGVDPLYNFTFYLVTYLLTYLQSYVATVGWDLQAYRHTTH